MAEKNAERFISEVTARIRDNAPPFDPLKKLEMYKKNEADPGKNMGIRLVPQIAKEMKYRQRSE